MRLSCVRAGVVGVLVAGVSACSFGSGLSGSSVPSPSVSSPGVSASVGVPSTAGPPSVVGSARAQAWESAAGRRVMERARGSVAAPREVAAFQVHPRLDGSVATVHVASVQAGPTGTVLTFWLTSPTLNSVMSVVRPEEYPSLIDTVGGVKYSVDSFSRSNTSFVVGSEEPEIEPDGVYLMQAAYPVLPDTVRKVKVAVGSEVSPVEVPVTR